MPDIESFLVCAAAPWAEKVWQRVRKNDGAWVVTTGPAAGLVGLFETVDPRFAFFLNWSSYVPAEIFERWECVNFHCTALPYGRGGGPIENLIKRGHAKTVMTAHKMTAEIDGGPIYAQYNGISLDGSKEEILDRFVDPCATLIELILSQRPTPTPQVGEIVRFERLPPDEHAAFWESR